MSILDLIKELENSKESTLSLEEAKKYIKKHENYLSVQDMENLAILISYSWINNEKEALIKKRTVPYKIKLLYKNSASKVDLSELPSKLIFLIVFYINYIFY